MTAGAVVWLTGLPGCGKSTLAARIVERLRAVGAPTLLLDGDAVRELLRPRPAYDREARAAFYETLANLALLAAAQGLVAVVAATANLRAHRDAARARAPRFVEVFVDVPAAECARRDPKGLWARAARGEIALPGATAPYEPPTAPEVIARGGLDDDAAARVVALLAI